jgi:hypothetical protein
MRRSAGLVESGTVRSNIGDHHARACEVEAERRIAERLREGWKARSRALKWIGFEDGLAIRPRAASFMVRAILIYRQSPMRHTNSYRPSIRLHDAVLSRT